MPEFNQGEFNTGEYNDSPNQNPDGPSFVFVPPGPPAITISAPLAPPPQQLTNVATLINGGYKEAGVMLFRNGILLTQGPDYSRINGIVTLVVPPGPTDVLTARVFGIGKALGGATQERYIAPWTFRLAGAFDSVSQVYHINFGPTITGICDGRNRLFQWGVQMQRVQVFRNGILQTFNQDIAAGQFAVVFLPGSIPQPNDLITILGY